MNKLAFGAKPAVLRCGRCGKFVDWEDARLQVVCPCRPHLELPPVLVREATPAEREKALEIIVHRDGLVGGCSGHPSDGCMQHANVLARSMDERARGLDGQATRRLAQTDSADLRYSVLLFGTM